MHFRFKNTSFIIVFVLLVGFSCSDESSPKPTIKTPAVFEHTFNCVPQSVTNGTKVDMQYFLDIETAPEIVDLGEKITAVKIDSIKFSFSVPDEEYYEVFGQLHFCAVIPGQVANCHSPLVVSSGTHSFTGFYNGWEGFLFFDESEIAEFEKSLFKEQLMTLSILFSFNSNDQGYPIESFGLTFKIFATIHSQE